MRTRKPRENPIDVSRWEEHFKSFFNIPRFYNTRFAGDLIDPNLDFEVSVGELNLVLRNCRENKAPVIKYLPEVVKQFVVRLFNDIMNKENTPSSWSLVKMFLLFKKGDPSGLDNYRGIALINTIAKVFTQMLSNRISCWAEGNGVLFFSSIYLSIYLSCRDLYFWLALARTEADMLNFYIFFYTSWLFLTINIVQITLIFI